jgi:hypothetical protein
MTGCLICLIAAAFGVKTKQGYRAFDFRVSATWTTKVCFIAAGTYQLFKIP